MYLEKSRVNLVLICLFFISLFTVADNLYRSSTLNVFSLQINNEIKNSEQPYADNEKRLSALLTLLEKSNETSYSLLILLDHELWGTNKYYENQIRYQANHKLYEILVSQAKIAAVQSNFEEAKARYRFALAVHPNAAAEWHWLGQVLWDDYRANRATLSEHEIINLVNEITLAFEKSVALDQINAEYLDSAGWFYYSVHNDPIIAIDYLSKAVSIQEEPNPWTLFKLGLAYRAIGDIDQGLTAFELAEANYEGPEVDFLKQIADIQWRTAQYEAAINTSSLAILRQPSCGDLYLTQSIYLLSACRIEDAKQTFAAGLSKSICATDNSALEELITEFEAQLDNQSCP